MKKKVVERSGIFCVREKNIKVHVYLQKESLSVGERYLGAINSF